MEFLKGIRWVSALMISDGSGFPIGPRKKQEGGSMRGIRIWFLRFYRERKKTSIRKQKNANRKPRTQETRREEEKWANSTNVPLGSWRWSPLRVPMRAIDATDDGEVTGLRW